MGQIFLRGVLEAHLSVEPVSGAFLEGTAEASFGAVEVHLCAEAEALVGVEVEAQRQVIAGNGGAV